MSDSEDSDYEDMDISEIMDWEFSENKPEDDYGVSICYDVLDTAFCTSKYMTPVGDQGGVDSCVPFTISAALGALMVIESVSPAAVDYCKQEVVDCLNILPGGIPYSLGFEYVKSFGLCLEDLYPYETKYYQPCRRVVSSTPKATFHEFFPLEDPGDILFLLRHTPLAAGLFVYESFSKHCAEWKSDADLLGVYRPEEGEPMLTRDDGRPLAHAVLVIGFSMHPQPCFIIKNWSDTSWGCKGYARVAAHLLIAFHLIQDFDWTM